MPLEQPRYIPREAAQRLLKPDFQPVTAPKAPTPKALPPANTLGILTSLQYLCTICRGLHINPKCPDYPRNRTKKPLAVLAYYSEDYDDDDLVLVNDSLYQLYQDVYYAKPSSPRQVPDSEGSSENDLSGHSGVVHRS